MKLDVICEHNGRLRFIGFSVSTFNDLTDIEFQVKLAANNSSQVFLIMKDTQTTLHEIIELEATTNGFGDVVYKIPVTYSLRLTQTSVTMQLMILDQETSTVKFSNVSEHAIPISASNYKLSHEIAMMNKLSNTTKVYYEAIVNTLKKIVEKGEKSE